ncbi:Phenazine biosynthesis PhzF protein [Penicillium concentricum]|uniref:Phenazine biosynthesis PhzF protein n=1 Tax=Penicillium concentricum TaxID=293559 RepID=A0A9W9SBQ7_9EURO|nr:Phenazine biosynthesis PhzF protein [Penicillium concentricum]KAJ5373258.1 Phenazine biosynthesis PhzF protein [Penicillium concentricum]
MSNQEMQLVALNHGHTSGFVFPAPAGFEFCHYEMRFWTPRYELERCSHAMIGTVWLLSKLGMTPQDDLRIVTKSGLMEARVTKAAENTDSTKNVIWDIWVEISHPKVTFMDDVSKGHADAMLSDLDISRDELAPGLRIQNAGMSKVKTMIPLESIEKLNDMNLDYRRAKKVCDKVKSTGLYAYVVTNRELQMYEAREFPKDYGHWEDTATALAFVLLLNNFLPNPHRTIRIRQGWTRDRRGEINLRFWKWGSEVVGCWIGGTAKFETEEREAGKAKT